MITIAIMIDGRNGWKEGNGLDKVEHWFEYRRDEYTETGRARDNGKGNGKVKGQEGRNGTRDEARQIVHGKEEKMEEPGKKIESVRQLTD